ncbi:AAA family ATPase [Nodularia chucula]|uniref:AAA family ATPase n=1 Tax=Nodularia chucula TaxID=3093667 RepID=UPI0039C5B19D
MISLIDGYKLREKLYQGSKTQIYRAVRSLDQQAVVIKLLQQEYPSFTELLQFRNQYTIAKNLNISGVIYPYSLETCGNSYALVMEDFGGISLREYTKNQPLELQDFFDIALQIVDILQGLYKHRIIHKDIKPANILINPETKQIKLIDFSIASLLPRETQEIKSPNVLEGTLAYLSPEQSGRMNRGIDYRSDFYTLGVTFYELLTGQLPFLSDVPMELIHCHIAKIPPTIKSQKIPQVLDNIIQKLMAKNAEDRYQSALGIKYDLEKCQLQLQEIGGIGDFPIAQQDICDRLMIPEKLYGREAEIQTLIAAFDRVSLGTTEMMLVTGFSGIGKTAVINEVHKPIVRQRGYFIKGKFDQFNRNIPFSGFVQAFRDLIRQLLTENDQQLKQWQNKILSALGENAQVIIQVIPELEKIIGAQPPAPKLLGTAAQTRFNLLFQKFVQVFTAKEHPLVIFLDDLQWVDSASLRLMQLLMDESHQGYLLLLAAYRDNEVSSTHPLMMALNNIQEAGAYIQKIHLTNLSSSQLNQLVAETLVCPEDLAWNLSKLVYQKTEGNPFFTTQFIKSLYQDGLIQFNWDLGCWQCDITQINQQAVTDNIVDFMTIQLEKLPESTQNILQLAACIGNQFDLATLAIVSELSEIEVSADLWKALEEGLVLPTGDIYKFFQHTDQDAQINASNTNSTPVAIYKFLHDRVQQAAYALIPDDQKEITHLKLGQLLLNNISASKKEEKIFQLVSQLNVGYKLINQQNKREQLAELNLLAGKKAMASTAYTAAVQYLMLGIEMLAADSWQSQYQLTLELYEVAATAEYLNTNFQQAINLTDQILAQTSQILDTIKAYELKVQVYIAQDHQVKAIETGLKALEQLKISLISSEEQEHTLAQILHLADLDNIPEMTNPESLAALRLLMSITPPIHHVKPEMFPSVTFTMLHLCGKEGISPVSAFAYGNYSVLLCTARKDVDTAYHYGQISLRLVEKYHSQEISSKVYMIFGVFVCAYKEHGSNTLKFLRDSIQCGLEGGDIEHASYSMMAECSHLFLIGENLNTVEERQAQCIDLLLKLKQKHCLDYAKIWRQVTLNLLGCCTDPYQLIGVDFDETEILPHLQNTHNHQSLFAFYFAKVFIFYTFGQYEKALTSAEKATEYIHGAFGILPVVAHNFYYSLCLLAEYNGENEKLAQVVSNQKLMQVWARYAAVNFQHKYDLIEAEIARVMGDHLQAIEYYDRAIAGAKKHEYLSEEALSNELAAKFYLEWGKEKLAPGYMQEAYYCYARWGAKAKIDHLEKQYSQLLQPIVQQRRLNINALETISHHSLISYKTRTSAPSSSSSNSNPFHHLDLATILKASQVLSREIDLDSLITTLTQVLLQNSGAEKVALILPEENTWVVTAIATMADVETGTPIPLKQIPLDSSTEVPCKLIYAVRQTGESILIDDISKDINWAGDAYIVTYQPKSVLCTPILNQGKLIGILYLENRLVTGAFTNDRLTILNFLSSQAAISLENSRLYQKSQQTLQELQQAQLQIVQSEKMSALGNLVAGVAHEMNNPLGFMAASLKQTKPTVADVVEHLRIYQQTFTNPTDEILDHAEEIDLDYILEDLPKVFDSMVIACDRLKHISTSLRTFSRADKDYKVYFNIHEGIDSTILILKHRLKANEQRPAIAVITNYAELPLIECFPGQINQVFMNVIANAIDALEESNIGRSFAEIEAKSNQITITTTLETNQVRITIADNAKGMSEAVQAKIFDHLFTTKAVGKGTGLGLAIARQIIVEKHGGTIDIKSALDQGTEFAICIPIHP